MEIYFRQIPEQISCTQILSEEQTCTGDTGISHPFPSFHSEIYIESSIFGININPPTITEIIAEINTAAAA